MAKRNHFTRWISGLQRQASWSTSAMAAGQKALQQPIVRAARKLQQRHKTTTTVPATFGGKWLQSWAMTSQGRMAYGLYLPPPDRSPSSLPLVVMLHGCTQTAAEFANCTQMNAFAAKKGFAVLYPQQSVIRDNRRCWHWYEKSTQIGGGDAAAVVELVRKVVLRQGVDRSKVYVAGLSAGAGLAHCLALHFPHDFAAAALHSPPVFGVTKNSLEALHTMQNGSVHRWAQAINQMAPPPVSSPPPVLVLHGTADRTVRLVNAYQVVQQWCLTHRIQHAPVVQVVSSKSGVRNPHRAYSVTDFGPVYRPTVRLVCIEGLGHAWSGGHKECRYSEALGAKSQASANALIWSFFKKPINT